MNARKMFVFRLSHNNETGEPQGSCSLNYSEVMQKIKNIKENEIDYIEYTDETLQFLHDELWNNNVLRQGWGLDGQDLRKKPFEKTNEDYMYRWNSHFMINEKKRHGRDVDCHCAKGRWNILKRMLDFKINDIIFLPKVAKGYIHDTYEYFTVCQVASEYYFAGPTQNDDFQHCIKVKNLTMFEYKKETLLSGDFGAPYRPAILEVRNNHIRYKKFLDFTSKHYQIN